MDLSRARAHLRDFRLKDLFVEELGWNSPRGLAAIDLVVDAATFRLRPVAEKAGFVVYASEGNPVPPHRVRVRLDRQLSKSTYEHLVVFEDRVVGRQLWQWVRREPGSPIRIHTHDYRATQSGQALLQKLADLDFGLDFDPAVGVTAVSGAVAGAFDVERVTKRFYDDFQKQQHAFDGLIEGIADGPNRHWYASLMLNRLMFVYFIQKKGFLDDDRDYLRNRLRRVRTDRGPGHFHSFYRMFLRRLFRDGLGTPEHARSAEDAALLGRVPYLNGGLFDVHSLELTYPEIDVPDEAFANVFAFFDRYEWSLDVRPDRPDNEINPDVLGFIFEKYVNQREMGAYYTKEDITEFMTRSSVVARLLDRVQSTNQVAFTTGVATWELMESNPDRYMFRGLATTAVLPTETRVEAAARQRHADFVRQRIASGLVRSTDDLLTLNLDIRQFAQDLVSYADGPDTIRAMYDALQEVTILDPTCGSGAFLFAALNVLEPLYDACLEAMDRLLDEAPTDDTGARYPDFRAILDDVGRHPNRRYFVYKTIALRNLFGVDIMEEAVEICKLRLFLKLVAQIDSVEYLEPLPDIDFNIRVGNSLVGFASLEHVRSVVEGIDQGRFDFDDSMGQIQAQAEAASRAFDDFRSRQSDPTWEGQGQAKDELESQLGTLRHELDRYLAREHGILAAGAIYDRWLGRHQPFHWMVEFYGVMSRGGFDVVVGNPPYISAAKVREQYRVMGFLTEGCGDIYAVVLERVTQLMSPHGRTSMIVPLNITFADSFDPLRRVLQEAYGRNWFSSFGRIPSALFSADVRVRNTIHVAARGGDHSSNTSVLHRWFTEFRPYLFEVLRYAPYDDEKWSGKIPKAPTRSLADAFAPSGRRQLRSWLSAGPSAFKLYYKKAAYNWLAFSFAPPPSYDLDGKAIPQTKVGSIDFASRELRDAAFLLLSEESIGDVRYRPASSEVVVTDSFAGVQLEAERLIHRGLQLRNKVGDVTHRLGVQIPGIGWKVLEHPPRMTRTFQISTSRLAPASARRASQAGSLLRCRNLLFRESAESAPVAAGLASRS